ncbi:FAD-dependent monooxygenase [Glycomyces harbinensis]|uniref:2-polyprenyl-6-methoxyphenol hydroxylase n=1 Tax=Glycomyces harbinensis TaxID=58114 RepID=A0A1G6QQI8_9ACTN|nr:FAD-dependent monooxygenase [Glycomyces harbinensis]SDC94609.1 2-polyprenyl-6-methoxyphenol hydroxylase [Glycomyces harbinensis]
MTAVRNVLISGASIAGPALAHWLHRRGIRSTVVEKAPERRTGGYAVDVRGAAVDVAERTGVLDDIRAATTGIAHVSVVDAEGKARTGFGTGLVAPGERSAEILRGDLVHLLCDAASDAEFRYGDSITALDQGGDHVTASFEGAPAEPFDLVVGADGLHSNVRSLAFGPERPYRRFLGSYVSIATIPNRLDLSGEARLFNTPGRVAGLYQTHRSEGAKALLLHRTEAETDIDRRTPEEQRAHLRAVFAGAGWETDQILSDMDDAADFYFDSVTQIHMGGWSKGRVALLGDAGHCPSPMSGQGTSLALVGAYVLAEELARQATPEAALTAYERRMRPYVSANQAIADPGLAFIAPRTRLGIAARDALLKSGPLLSFLSRFDTKLSKASEAIALDER